MRLTKIVAHLLRCATTVYGIVKMFKKSRFFKIISSVLIFTFISLDISYAYPPEHSSNNFALAIPSGLQQTPVNDQAARFQQSIFSQGALLASIFDIGEYCFGNPEKEIGPISPKYAKVEIRTDLKKHLSDAGTEILDIVPVEDIKARTAPEKLKSALDEIGFKGKLPDEGVVFVLYKKGDKKFLVQIARKDRVSPENLPGYEWVVSDKYLVKYMPQDYVEVTPQLSAVGQAISSPTVAKEIPPAAISEPIAEVPRPESTITISQNKSFSIKAILNSITGKMYSINHLAAALGIGAAGSALFIMKDLAFAHPLITVIAVICLLCLVRSRLFPINEHIYYLGYPFSFIREDARRSLVKIGGRAVPALIRAAMNYNIDNDVRRKEALIALACIRDPRSVNPLIIALRSYKDPVILSAVADALVKMGLLEEIFDHYILTAPYGDKIAELIVKAMFSDKARRLGVIGASVKPESSQVADAIESIRKFGNFDLVVKKDKDVSIEAALVEVLPPKEARTASPQNPVPAELATVNTIRGSVLLEITMRKEISTQALFALVQDKVPATMENLTSALKKLEPLSKQADLSADAISQAIASAQVEYKLSEEETKIIWLALAGPGQGMGEMGAAELSSLIRALGSTDTNTRVAAAEILRGTKSKLLQPLIDTLEYIKNNFLTYEEVQTILDCIASGTVLEVIYIPPTHHTEYDSPMAPGNTADYWDVEDSPARIMIRKGSGKLIEPQKPEQVGDGKALAASEQERRQDLEAAIANTGLLVVRPSLASQENFDLAIKMFTEDGWKDHGLACVLIAMMVHHNKSLATRTNLAKVRGMLNSGSPVIRNYGLSSIAAFVHADRTLADEGLLKEIKDRACDEAAAVRGEALMALPSVLGYFPTEDNMKFLIEMLKDTDATVRYYALQAMLVIVPYNKAVVTESNLNKVLNMLMDTDRRVRMGGAVEAISSFSGSDQAKAAFTKANLKFSLSMLKDERAGVREVAIYAIHSFVNVNKEYATGDVLRDIFLSVRDGNNGVQHVALAMTPLIFGSANKDSLTEDNLDLLRNMASGHESGIVKESARIAMKAWDIFHISQDAQTGPAKATESEGLLSVGFKKAEETRNFWLSTTGSRQGAAEEGGSDEILREPSKTVDFAALRNALGKASAALTSRLGVETVLSLGGSAGVLVLTEAVVPCDKVKDLDIEVNVNVAVDGKILAENLEEAFNAASSETGIALSGVVIDSPHIKGFLSLGKGPGSVGYDIDFILKQLNCPLTPENIKAFHVKFIKNMIRKAKSIFWVREKLADGTIVYKIIDQAKDPRKYIIRYLTHELFFGEWEIFKKAAMEFIKAGEDKYPALVNEINRSGRVEIITAKIRDILKAEEVGSTQKPVSVDVEKMADSIEASIGEIMERPELECKKTHVRNVVASLNAFIKRDWGKFYGEFKDEVRPSVAEHVAMMEELYAMYQRLSPIRKIQLRIAIILHDLGLKEGEKDTARRRKAEAKYVKDLLLKAGFTEEIAQGVYRIKELYGINDDIGFSFLPQDAKEMPEYLRDQITIMSCINLTDSGKNQNQLTPKVFKEEKEATSPATIERLLTGDNLFEYRFRNLMTPRFIVTNGFLPRMTEEQFAKLDSMPTIDIIRQEWGRHIVISDFMFWRKLAVADFEKFLKFVEEAAIQSKRIVGETGAERTELKITDGAIKVMQASGSGEAGMESARTRAPESVQQNASPLFVTLMVNKDLQGLNFKDVERAIASGKTAIAEVSVDWAKKIKETYPNDAYTIFISPLSERQIRERMQNKGQTREEVIFEEMKERQKERAPERPTSEEKQLARARGAVTEMTRQNEYDTVIVNSELKDLERDAVRWAGEEGARVVIQFMSAVDNARKSGKKLILYSGPSATGKSPLWNQVRQKYENQFSRIVLYTTRQPNKGEEYGVDFYFKSVEELKRLEKELNAPSLIDNKDGNQKESGNSAQPETAQIYKTTQLFELVEKAGNDRRAEYVDAGNRLISSLPAAAAAEPTLYIGTLNKDASTAEIRERIERAIEIASVASLPRNDGNMEFLKKNLKQFEADGAAGALIFLAREAKKENQKLIIGLETDWIPGIDETGYGSQHDAINILLQEIRSIGKLIRDLGLDNVEIVEGSGDVLAGALLDRVKDTKTDLSNVVVFASSTTINSPSFDQLRSAAAEKRAFLAGIDASEIAEFYRVNKEAMKASRKQLHIRLAALLYMALEAAAGKEPPHAPWIHYDGTKRTLILLPKADLVDYEELVDTYKAEKTALAAA